MAITQYELHNWTDAELITAAKLNEMDRAIVAINNGAIPNESNASMLLKNELTFTNQNDYEQTSVIFARGDKDNGTGGRIIYDQANEKWMFRHLTSGESYEDFNLPISTNSTGKYYYDILTTKFPVIPKDTDLNNLTKFGFYYVGSYANVQTLTNIPEIWYATVAVLPTAGGNYFAQYWFGARRIYQRYHNENGWSSWAQVFARSDA